MATSKQIKQYMLANNATREEAEAHFKNVDLPESSFQDQLQIEKPFTEVNGYLLMSFSDIGCKDNKVTTGIVNYQMMEGMNTVPTHCGTTKRGALYPMIREGNLSNNKNFNEWYIVFERIDNKSQLIIGFIGTKKPKIEEAEIYFINLSNSLQQAGDTAASNLMSNIWCNNLMDIFVSDIYESGLGNVGWINHK